MNDPDADTERTWPENGAMQHDRPADGPFDNAHFAIEWVDRGREPTHPADPANPDGCAIDVALTALKACRIELPFPAARCGVWLVRCLKCGFTIALATTGRRDDPRTLRVPCKLH